MVGHQRYWQLRNSGLGIETADVLQNEQREATKNSTLKNSEDVS